MGSGQWAVGSEHPEAVEVQVRQDILVGSGSVGVGLRLESVSKVRDRVSCRMHRHIQAQ